MQIPKYYFALLASLFIVSATWSQQESQYSLFRHHLNMVNPAVTGTQGVPFLNMTFRSQWQGVKDAPEVQAVSFGTPTEGERVGVGFSVVNDANFVEQQTLFFGNFSYRLPLNEQTNLFLGLQAGANGYRVTAYGLKTYGIDSQDPNLINYSRFNPNLGVGFYLRHPNYYVSLSAPRILNSHRFLDVEGLYTTAADRIHTYASAGAYIPLTPSWELIPAFLMRYVPNAPFLATFNLAFAYNQTLDFGLEFNLQSGFGANMMIDTGNTFSFGYAYVASMHKEISQFSKGTHEAIVKIKLAQGVGRPRQIKYGTVNSSRSRGRVDRRERRTGSKSKGNIQ